MKRDLLIIEKNTRDSLASRLSDHGYSVCLAATGTKALEALRQHNITHAVILNAISTRSNGARICTSLKRAAPGFPILIYSDREKPAKADVLLRPGISTRKLINRVELYSPLDKKHCLQYGDIFLDEEKQRVFAPKGVSHLSTKEIQILKYLIKKKGALVPKEELFTRIWKTSYVGDMNTLYTYINFLRGAIEQDGYFCISPQKGIFQVRTTLLLQQQLTRMGKGNVSVTRISNFFHVPMTWQTISGLNLFGGMCKKPHHALTTWS